MKLSAQNIWAISNYVYVANLSLLIIIDIFSLFSKLIISESCKLTTVIERRHILNLLLFSGIQRFRIIHIGRMNANKIIRFFFHFIHFISIFICVFIFIQIKVWKGIQWLLKCQVENCSYLHIFNINWFMSWLQLLMLITSLFGRTNSILKVLREIFRFLLWIWNNCVGAWFPSSWANFTMAVGILECLY